MNAETNELLIQRLVDGEMDPAQRCQFLFQLDQQPELWRHVALAFVEDQALRCAYQSYPSRPIDVGPPEAQHVSGHERLRRATWDQSRTIGWLLAASLLVALSGFGVGYWSGHGWKPAAAGLESPVGGELPVANKGPDESGPDESGPEYRLRFVDHQPGNDRVMEVPVWGSTQNWPPPGTRIPESLQRTFMNLGYEVQQDTQYISGHLDDGRQVVLPVSRVDVRFRGQ